MKMSEKIKQAWCNLPESAYDATVLMAMMKQQAERDRRYAAYLKSDDALRSSNSAVKKEMIDNWSPREIAEAWFSDFTDADRRRHHVEGSLRAAKRRQHGYKSYSYGVESVPDVIRMAVEDERDALRAEANK